MHEQKLPWLLLLPDDLGVDINLNMVLYNKLEAVSEGKLYSSYHQLILSNSLVPSMSPKKKNEQAGTQQSLTSNKQ